MEHCINRAGWRRPDKPQRAQEPAQLSRQTNSATELTVADLADIVNLLERKLAWFGLHSVRIGPYVQIRNGSILIDLLDGDETFCRIALGRRQGVMAFPSGNALRPLMTSLQKEFCSRQAR
jgi:hypothetical protein